MSVDINQDLRDISSKLGVYQTYKEFKVGYDDLKKRAGDSFEEDQKYVKELLGNFDRTDRKKQDNSCQPFIESLLKQLRQLKGSGFGTETFVKRIFLDTLKDLKGDLIELLLDLFKKELNCGINQEYQPNTTFYIPVSMVDLFGMLENSPEDKLGKLFYEPATGATYSQYLADPTVNSFSMNRELYKRTQNLNQTFSSVEGDNYKGTSSQNLFDISYVESYVDPVTLQTENGSFFKVELKPRQTILTPDQFLSDYLSSIDVLEFKNFFTYLSNFVTGAISFGQNDGKRKLGAIQKAMAFNKRISCLCSDRNQEISVAGTSKVSEIDNVDNSFFDLTEVELRIIEQNISNVKLGVVEFEDCDNIKVPLNVDALVTALDDLNFNENTDDLNEFENALNIINPAVDNAFTGSINSSYLQQFLNALVGSILSPKVILPFMTMLYATKQQVPPQVKNIEDFAKQYRTFYIEFVSKILSKFTQRVLRELKKQILRLVTLLNTDILSEKKQKIQDMILSIVSLIATPLNFVRDFRECKAGIDELLALLNAGVNRRIDNIRRSGGDIPLPLLLSSRLLDGYSSSRAFLNTIENLEELGIPTGPMPDGSPNKFVASIKAMIDGNSKEVAENGKVAIGVGPLTITPAGITIPTDAYGKFI
jgi:hypothetical protein